LRTEWAAKRARILVPILVVFVLGSAALSESYRRGGQGAERIVSGLLGQKKHTDYQRNFVWQAALKIAANNPVFGAGPVGLRAR
ncbi:MAG: hypothetical protein HY042_03430, partial [Spirochaetia bacterium]|nr:hypothetical protein [Spirochaetia bacterium]